MSSPRLVSGRFPYLPIHLEVRRGMHDLELLLDTGFDGDVSLPPELIMNGAPPMDISAGRSPTGQPCLRLITLAPFAWVLRSFPASW
jgi:hypothetical protein